MTTDTSVAPASSPAPTPGRAPVAAPKAGYIGAFLAVVLLAVGVIVLRDTTVYLGWLRGAPWLTSAIVEVDGARPAGWMIPVGVVMAILGLWWTIVALSPRRRIAAELTSASSVWIGTGDIARIASHAAESVPGVLAAKATATLRKVKVSAQVASGNRAADLQSDVVAAVSQSLTALAVTPKVAVRIQRGGHR